MPAGSREDLLRTGDIRRTLTRLSTPAIIAMFSIAFYNLVDTIYIGLLNDTPSIGAATVMFPVYIIVSSLGLMFGSGAGSAISRYLGSGRSEEASSIAATAYFSCLAVGILFGFFGVLNIRYILTLFGATDAIMDRAVIYGSIIIGGSLFQMLNMCLNNVVRAEGAASYSGRAMVLGALLNILLDPLFMFVFRLGITGAAIATITSQCISNLYLMRFFHCCRGIIRIHLSFFRFSGGYYREIMKIGIPTFIRQLLVSVSMGVMNNHAALFGNAAIAAIGIVTRLVAVVNYVNIGMGQGLQPVAGYNYGARQFDRVRCAYRVTLIRSSAVCVGAAAVFLLAPAFLVRLFSRDPAVIAIGARALRFLATTLTLLGFQNTSSVFFQSLGKGWETAFLAMARQGIFLVPLVVLLTRNFGLTGLIASQPVADVLTVIFTAVLILVNARNLKREEAAG